MIGLFFRILIFDILGAFLVAKMEIQIEGKNGWAAELPTQLIKNKFLRAILTNGTKPFTYYHLWIFLMVLVFLHLPFFVAPSLWSISMEIFLLANYMLAIVLEDLFWFIFNPNFGIKKLNQEFATWHLFWGPIPVMYLRILAVYLVLIGVSFWLGF